MILSMVTLPGFAAGAADLSAGCVVYSDVDGNQIRSLTGGAAVKASTDHPATQAVRLRMLWSG